MPPEVWKPRNLPGCFPQSGHLQLCRACRRVGTAGSAPNEAAGRGSADMEQPTRAADASVRTFHTSSRRPSGPRAANRTAARALPLRSRREPAVSPAAHTPTAKAP